MRYFNSFCDIESSKCGIHNYSTFWLDLSIFQVLIRLMWLVAPGQYSVRDIKVKQRHLGQNTQDNGGHNPIVDFAIISPTKS